MLPSLIVATPSLLSELIINLTPANVAKEGTHLDLAIALSILVASNQLPAAAIKDTMMVGELGLNGELHPVAGTL